MADRLFFGGRATLASQASYDASGELESDGLGSGDLADGVVEGQAQDFDEEVIVNIVRDSQQGTQLLGR